MAQAEVVKNLIRPPFATYDVVVYFGCGLFALPFLNHYLVEPFGLKLPAFEMKSNIPFAGAFISTLALLFAVYILGHMIAYAGSQVIEKTVDTFFGKTSQVVLATSGAKLGDRNPILRTEIRARTAEMWKAARFVTIIRAISHLPLWPVYGVLYLVGAFGFYGSRVPEHVFKAVAANMKLIGFPAAVPAPGRAWFKTLEAYVMNHLPIATARMYNYLVIYGLFRSMAFIFLAAIWAEVIYLLDRLFTGHVHISFLMTNSTSWAAELWSLGVLYVGFVFALWSYLKFLRRYVEEAVFAFGTSKIGN
jgi:hypothetical protein